MSHFSVLHQAGKWNLSIWRADTTAEWCGSYDIQAISPDDWCLWLWWCLRCAWHVILILILLLTTLILNSVCLIWWLIQCHDVWPWIYILDLSNSHTQHYNIIYVVLRRRITTMSKLSRTLLKDMCKSHRRRLTPPSPPWAPSLSNKRSRNEEVTGGSNHYCCAWHHHWGQSRTV